MLLVLCLHDLDLLVSRDHDLRVGLEIDFATAASVGVELQDQLQRFAAREMLVVGADDPPG